ncbi:NAD(P)-binding protein [Plenodomus tracheiphilus IPT5]|uniref:NAD(P)-binding protein n=1 Tax=Plenodomus tracheiphilus IPT5 TaxID=1408161 RepID=A0A6A7BKZ8_9PLEO|nr:NAD(P)-binding protein [Plenodomus tracheiphilus IPT5]
MSKQRLLVLGATGPTGLHFCEAALRNNHPLTLYVRNPSKLHPTITSNPTVKVIKGELTSQEGLESAVASGASILISFLGPGPGHQGTPLANAYKSLFPLLQTHSYTRALILSTASWYSTPPDVLTVKWRAIASLVWTFAGAAYKDINAVGDFVSKVPVSEVKWTMFRVPFLNDGEVRETFAGPLDGRAGLKLSRKSMVEWVLREVGGEEWVGKAPCLWN